MRRVMLGFALPGLVLGVMLVGAAPAHTQGVAGSAMYAGDGFRPAAPAQMAVAQQTAAVQIVDFGFTPSALTVPVGATVTWTQTGNAPHTVTAAGGAFSSKSLDKGQTFAFTFAQAGEFAYRCEIHPAMTGTITAQAAAGAPPTIAATAAAPAPAGAQRGAAGVATFSDGQDRNDRVRLEVQGLSPQAGAALTGWLTSAGGEAQRLGTLTPDAAGKAALTYTDQQRRDLIALFNRVLVTAEPGAGGSKPAGTELLRDETPLPAMVHIRHLLSRFQDAPQGTPLAIGLLGQAAVAAEHANLAVAAAGAGDLAGTRLHLEHILNTIDGEKGANFGDHNGNGRKDNPGDGFGVLNYAGFAAQHAQLAVDGAPQAEAVKVHAAHVIIASRNAAGWATEARDLALSTQRTPAVAAMRPSLARISELLTAALEGRDANGDGRVDPVPGEGGARIAHIHSQLMASLAPVPARAADTSPAATAQPAAAAAPTAASGPAPTPAPAAAAAGGSSGGRLVLIAALVTALLVAGLALGAWLGTRRSGQR